MSDLEANDDDGITQSDYLSFDYQYHQHLSHWNTQNLCLPIFVVGSTFIILFLLSPRAGICLAVILSLVCLTFSFGPTNRRLRILSNARRARHEIKSQSGLSADNEKKATHSNMELHRDWSKASGWYQSKVHRDAGKIALEFVPFDSIFLHTNNPVWSVRGHSEDASFRIQHGLVAENGNLYWLESHRNSAGWIGGTSVAEGCGPNLLRRMVLVQGTLSYDTFQFSGTWTDSVDSTGAYEVLERYSDLDSAPIASRIPIEIIEVGCGGDEVSLS